MPGLQWVPAVSQRTRVVSAFRPSPSDKDSTVSALIPHVVPSAAAVVRLVGNDAKVSISIPEVYVVQEHGLEQLYFFPLIFCHLEEVLS